MQSSKFWRTRPKILLWYHSVRQIRNILSSLLPVSTWKRKGKICVWFELHTIYERSFFIVMLSRSWVISYRQRFRNYHHIFFIFLVTCHINKQNGKNIFVNPQNGKYWSWNISNLYKHKKNKNKKNNFLIVSSSSLYLYLKKKMLSERLNLERIWTKKLFHRSQSFNKNRINNQLSLA